MTQIHPNKVRQVLFLGIIILLFWILWQQMYFMLSAFFGALALYVLMRRLMFKLIIEKKWKRWIVALLLMITSLVVIVLPFAWIISILINKVEPLIANPKPIYGMVDSIDNYLQREWNFKAFTTEKVNEVIGMATAYAPKLIGSTLVVVSNIGIMYFVLYFMIVKCNDMELWLRRNLPLKNRNSEKVLTEIREMVKSNAIGIPVLAIIQGVVAMIGYYMFGVSDPMLWGIITGLCSVIPLVGTMLAWIPISLYMFATGDTSAGIWLLLWGLIVIGSSDNVGRFILQKKLADVNPMVTVFGVIIGMNLFGFMGLIYGPLMISMFLLLVRIYNDEFAIKDSIPE